ncbi:MAG TPA: MarR family transcriptional regulator [Acidimicrobiales bacterium]|nr:MarR family transcriptional regulator [Acidimicrobiales bacterium]
MALQTPDQDQLRQESASDQLRDPITVVGLILECAIGLRRRLSPSMDIATGVTGQAFEVLVRLYRSEGGAMRMSDLAAQTGLTRSGLTRALDRLVEGGLCKRESCDGDRRGMFAALTEIGKSRVAAAILNHEQEISDLLAGALGNEDEEELIKLLRRVRQRVNPDAAFLSTINSLANGQESDI